MNDLKQVFPKLSVVWSVVVVYQIITILLIAYFDFSFFQSPGFLISRIVILIYLVVRIIIESNFLHKYGILIDTLLIYTLLAYFYGETAHLNTFFFPKIDFMLSNWDQFIFGFQPSVLFSDKFSNPFFSEFMFFGYFSYYLMPLIAFVMMWIYRRSEFEKFSFLVLSAYFVYYLIFVILPAEGPQFFFQAPFNQTQAQGPFAIIVKLIQKSGEAPTAAFPSSHVGIMVIILSLLFKLHKKLFKIFIPLSIMLLFSTIYIKAHYFVDVMAGLLSAPIVLIFNNYVYSKVNSLFKTTIDGY